MTESVALRVKNQIPEVFNFIADAMEGNPMLHFDAALELADQHFDHELADILREVVSVISLGSGHFESMKKVAERHDIPAFTEAVAFIIQTHQPDGSFITADTLRRAVAQSG